MRISELGTWAAEDLRFAARESDNINKPIADPPTPGQLLHLRWNNFVIGPEGQVYRVCTPGVLRECYQGIPCSWDCGGVESGKCTEVPMPSCNIPSGCDQKGHKWCPRPCPVVADCRFKDSVSRAQWSVDGMLDETTVAFSLSPIQLLGRPCSWKVNRWIDRTPPEEFRFFHTHTGTSTELIELIEQARKCMLVFKLTSAENKLLATWQFSIATIRLACEMNENIKLHGNFYAPWVIYYNRERYEEHRDEQSSND